MKKILFVLSGVFLLCACQKNERITYNQKRGLSFYSSGAFSNADSIIYSFIAEATQGNTDTVWIPMFLTGVLSETALSFRLEAAESSTAQEGVHYDFTERSFPANTVYFDYPLVLRRTDELENETRTLDLRLIENENFTLGPLSEEESFMLNETRVTNRPALRIHITDQFVRPTWWQDAEVYYYGGYSETKYRFMVQTVGISNFSTTALNYPLIVNYQSLLRSALTEYQRINGFPLRDENGLVVSF